ncbi:Olfactory Receptor 7G3 [Manis pentadactyla]|nr:Olfactory Receptor 7G3 [Manis pentadactyla]
MSIFSLRLINNMTLENISVATEFLLLGFSNDPEMQPLLFGMFLFMYLVTILGNLLIILAISSDSHLHTPMYFFLCNLSFVDICFTSTTTPKMLVNIKTQNKSISYTGCLTQICFVLTFVGLENEILMMMAFDRFVAICHPLRYNVIMHPKICGLLVLISLLISVLDALLHTLMVLRLSFCTEPEIPQFFCELAHVLKLACSDILINNILVYIVTSLGGVVPLSGIIFSYTRIVFSILKIQSGGGRFINNMKPTNHTDVSEFLLLGLTEDPELQPIIFGLFLSMYLFTILGNLLIILAVSSDSHLHTPMYFFLSNLSFTDICLSTTTVPKMLVNIQAQSQYISYTGCILQICFVVDFIGFESCLLAAMAYDRYVAICHPLRYTVIMNPQLCVLLILLSLLLSTGNALLHSLMVLRLSFCGDLEVHQFFCELAQVFKLACSDTLINNILLYFVSGLFGGIALFWLMLYRCIASTEDIYAGLQDIWSHPNSPYCDII